MPTGIGQTQRVGLMTALFKNTSFTAIAATHVGLNTGDPGVDGQAGNETTGTGYARTQVTINTGWSTPTAANPSVVNNVADIIFPAAGSGGWSGTISHFSLWNHASNSAAANFLWGGTLSPSQAIANGNVATIPATTLVFNLSAV